MAVGNINELPESILLELFTHIPARQLLLRCRPVCSLWRDLIDLVTLWKRKCLREGFITEDWDQPVADWKIFYFLRSLHRNLLHNPCAEEGFEFWSLDVNGGDEWKVEDLSGDQRKEFPNDQHLPQVPGGGPQGRRVLGGADGHHTAGHRGQGLVRSQAGLRVQVPAVRSAPVVSTRTPGDLPARPGNHPAEERCQVEGGVWARERAGGISPMAETAVTGLGSHPSSAASHPGKDAGKATSETVDRSWSRTSALTTL
ncbi:uncharacterized protein FBXO44 isoform X2 [Canis lupus familiaris]|uniref:uncharacterized protein FBXO44 isoform X2 n=1 Tax=Canis lupus familiaris TaxID=9615 RepID=UPI0018F79A2D|nr:uncharacterized protein FBXO44 isoform X2 [Canis lupus familiaris]XP_038387951.1 uncharacterized protein FBXO44 isoform X2 [Canis lupus familiaris]XP_038516288.1 uncharacterized protein FBXO44 isoform X2 [Canis lupus familiaris]